MADVEDVAWTAARALEHLVDPDTQLAPRSQERRRVEIPLHGSLEPDVLPRLVERQRPVEADDVTTALRRVGEVGAHAESEVDHRNARGRDLREQLAVVRRDVPEVVLPAERATGPRAEH